MQGKDIKLFDEFDCSRLDATVSVDATGTKAYMDVTGAVQGHNYVLGVKYDTKSIIGNQWVDGAEEANFYWQTKLNGTLDPNSYGTIGAVDCSAKSAEIITQESDLSVFPNPFDDKVRFEFTLEKDANVVLDIYNMMGQKVTTLMDQHVEGGVMNTVEYKPLYEISGIYIYRFTVDGNNSQVGKLIYKNE